MSVVEKVVECSVDFGELSGFSEASVDRSESGDSYFLAVEGNVVGEEIDRALFPVVVSAIAVNTRVRGGDVQLDKGLILKTEQVLPARVSLSAWSWTPRTDGVGGVTVKVESESEDSPEANYADVVPDKAGNFGLEIDGAIRTAGPIAESTTSSDGVSAHARGCPVRDLPEGAEEKSDFNSYV